MIIGQKIKELRGENNVTQETLATHLGVTSQAVSKWEQGLSLPDISLLIPLADFFSVSIDSLLREKPKPPKFDLSWVEIKKVRSMVGEDFCITEYHFKNVSSLYIRSIDIKYIFKDEDGRIIDYNRDYVFDLDPGFTRHSYARTRATRKPAKIEIEIIDYSLA